MTAGYENAANGANAAIAVQPSFFQRYLAKPAQSTEWAGRGHMCRRGTGRGGRRAFTNRAKLGPDADFEPCGAGAQNRLTYAFAFVKIYVLRRDGGAVERGGLENR